MKPFLAKNAWALFFAFFIVFPCVWMLLDRVQPVDWEFVGAVPPELRAGDRISISWKVMPHRNCGGTVARNFVDANGRIYQFSELPMIRLEAATKPYVLQGPEFRLPEGIAPGPLQYHPSGFFWCNFMQENFMPVPLDFPTVTLNILPGKGTPDATHSIPSDSLEQRLPF